MVGCVFVFDIVLKNGHVIDGTGNPWFRADVGIRDGKICEVDTIDGAKAGRTIDVHGLVVCPGFIDMHSHSDLTLLVNPQAESKVRQGVTTDVIGNCGFSAAPLKNETLDDVKTFSQSLACGAKIDWDWLSLSDYLDRLRRNGTSINVVPFVGHSVLRISVMGARASDQPTSGEMGEMKTMLRDAMEDGAFGMSSGLGYPPSCHADTEELTELCKVMAQYNGIYNTHMRDYSDKIMDAAKEAVEIGEKAGVSVEIAHYKPEGKRNWPKVNECLSLIESARERGVDVTFNTYPYVAGEAPIIYAGMIPPWAQEGGMQKLVERLKDPKVREKIKKQAKEGTGGMRDVVVQIATWDDVSISFSKKDKTVQGKTISEIATERGIADPYDVIFDLIISEEGALSYCIVIANEEVLSATIRHPVSSIGSDGMAFAPYGVLRDVKPHPRYYGTFPRILGKYVRAEHVLTLQDAVRKMSSLPAQKLGLRDRGLLREGFHADVVVLDPETVIDMATFDDPHQYPAGIGYVLVNGRMVIDNGQHTGVAAGEIPPKRYFKNVSE